MLSDKEFGLLGRDFLPKNGVNNITAEHLPAVKGYKTHVKLIVGILSDADYQIELDEEAKDICTINTSQGLFKMCRLPQGLKNSSSILQNCIESTLKGIKGVVIFQDDVGRHCVYLHLCLPAPVSNTANVLQSQKNTSTSSRQGQRSANKWSDKESLNRYSQEESLMHLQWCGRERRVEN